jgi:hypothetical protein
MIQQATPIASTTKVGSEIECVSFSAQRAERTADRADQFDESHAPNLWTIRTGNAAAVEMTGDEPSAAR